MTARQDCHISIAPLIVALVVLALLAVYIRYHLDSIEPLPADAPASVFSAGRAFAALQKLNPEQVAHPVDSDADREVAERLVAALRALGYREDIQEARVCNDSSARSARCTRVRNVIVKIDGRERGHGILLSAHYDSVPAGPGGSDDGVGVGTLLEIARLLKTQPQPRNTIVLLFNEGEEFGLFGAEAFMREHPLARQLRLAINIEARGNRGKSVMFETGEDSGWLVRQYAAATPAPLSSSLFYEVYKYLPNDTDLTVYKKHGLEGLNFANAEREAHYHTPLDNFANLDKGSLQHHGDNAWGVLERIKDADLGHVKKGNLVYTDVLGLFVVHWPESWGGLVIGVLLILLAGLRWQAQRQGRLHRRGILVGVVAALLALIVAAATAWLVQLALQASARGVEPWRAYPLPMRIGLWLAVAVTGLLAVRAAVRNTPAYDLAVGVAFAWVGLALACSIWLPGVSFLFVIPAAIALLLLLAQTALGRGTGRAGLPLALILIALAAGASFMPLAYTLEIMLGFGLSPAIGAALGLVLGGMVPLLAFAVEKPRGQRAASLWRRIRTMTLLFAGMALVAVAALARTVLQPDVSAETPQPLNVIYVQSPSGRTDNALVILGDERTIPGRSLRDAAGKLDMESALPWSDRRYLVKQVASAGLKPLSVEVTTDTATEQGRQIELHVESDSPGLSDVVLHIPKAAGLSRILYGEETLEYAGKNGVHDGYDHFHCRGRSCADLRLQLELTSRQKVEIYAVAVEPGVPAPLRHLQDARGELAVPRQAGDRSMVVAKLEI